MSQPTPTKKPDPKKLVALDAAVAKGDLAKLRALLAEGIPVDAPVWDSTVTALMRAAANNQPEAARVLLEAGADPHAHGEMGDRHTVLHYAAINGSMEVVQMLLERGVDVNARNGSGLTPLHATLDNFFLPDQTRLKIARTLIEAGADVNAKAKNGRTALDYAGDKAELRQLLLDAGAKVPVPKYLAKVKTNPTDPDVFAEAINAGDVATVRTMLAAGVSIEARNRQDETPLQRAVACANLEIVEILLAAGADPHVKDDEGSNLLHTAAFKDNVALVRKLLSLGLDVNKADEDGFTPLMAAAVEGCAEIAKVLLEAGADVNARGSFAHDENKTALEFANRNRHQAVAELLRQAGGPADTSQPAFDAVEGFVTAAEQPAFQELVQRLGELRGKPLARWKKCKGVYSFTLKGDAEQAGRYTGDESFKQTLLATKSRGKRARLLLDRLHHEVRDAGFQLVEAEAGELLPKLLLFPTDNKYAVIAAAETDCNNPGQGTRDIIIWLQEMEKDNPFVLTGCGHDFVAGEFLQPVANAKKLAARMVEFCPDLVDGESIESPADVARLLKANQSFFFWWD
jgi:ankyrin repeat protein